MDATAIVYQRTDRYETFPGVDPQEIRHYDRSLKQKADLTLFCSRYLFESEADDCRAAEYVDHGVDFEIFSNAAIVDGGEPADIATIHRPRVGFVGSIDDHTFDSSFFLEVTRRLPEASYVLVGPCSLEDAWCNAPNVFLLGQRPLESVARYMAACDVLIMPWRQNDWIRSCNPVKLKEYLAVGRPIVSRPFEEIYRYADYVKIALEPAGFVSAIRDALDDPGDATVRRERVRGETWTAKAHRVLDELAARGITPSVQTVQRADAAGIASGVI